MRFRLRDRQQNGLVGILRSPLRDGVKEAHRVELVAEEFRAHRRFIRGRIHIQDTAAQRKLAHALDQTRARIARARQTRNKIVQIVARLRLQHDRRGKQRLARHRPQQKRVDARHQHRHASLRQLIKQAQPFLLPLPRRADRARERQLARRQYRRLLAQKRAELGGDARRGELILTHRDERAAGMLVQRREHVAARRLAQTRDGCGLPRVHGGKQLLIIGAFVQKLMQNIHRDLLKIADFCVFCPTGNAHRRRFLLCVCRGHYAFKIAFRYTARRPCRSRAR